MKAAKQQSLSRLGACQKRTRRLVRRLTSKQREEQFTREEQLWMVVIGHGLILAGVCLIMGFLFADTWTWPPRGFSILELVIITLSYIAASATSANLISGIEKVGLGVEWLKHFIETHRHWKARIQATVLLSVYVLQIAALVPLLKATGGPIDSPFAPMALAIAIFTPFIVNKWWTIGFIVTSTMVFYAVFVARFGFGPDMAQAATTQQASAVPSDVRPKPASFVAVNLFILGLASLMTLRRRDSRSFTMTRTIAAPRADVWRYWTDPVCVTRWFGVESKVEVEVQMNVHEGGNWSAAIREEDGTLGIPWTGTYEEVKEPERLVFTLNSRPDLGHERVSVTLKEVDHRTEMVVRQSDDGRHTELKHGWSVFFDRMERQLRRPADEEPKATEPPVPNPAGS
jgi:uncharacterized protein YndB with AHSA1/START domain